jgi:hypothetical protein
MAANPRALRLRSKESKQDERGQQAVMFGRRLTLEECEGLPEALLSAASRYGELRIESCHR